MARIKRNRAAALVIGLVACSSAAPAAAAPPPSDTFAGATGLGPVSSDEDRGTPPDVLPPDVVVMVDREARWVVGTGVFTGTATCSPLRGFQLISGTLRQPGRRNRTIVGQSDFGAELICDGASHPWSMFVGPSDFDFPFRPGNAIITITNSDSDLRITRRVKLREDRSGPNPGRSELPSGA